MGYVLPFGQMSFWGATVITNLLSPFPSLIEWVSGGHYVYNPTLKRFFLFHFILPFLNCGFRILHLFYLHFLSSNNPLRNSTNNKIPFFPYIFIKDFFGFILILSLYLLQTHFGISSFSHPDNALEVCGLLTPLHIVPEWYFLCQYAMLKAVPNKNAGFIILLTSIFILLFFGEIRNLTTLCLLNNNGFSLSSFFSLSLSFLWIGSQFPQEKFLSYGRILTLYFYFLLMCILFSFLYCSNGRWNASSLSISPSNSSSNAYSMAEDYLSTNKDLSRPSVSSDIIWKVLYGSCRNLSSSTPYFSFLCHL